MTIYQFSTFLDRSAMTIDEHQRLGQRMFNELNAEHRHIADEIRGTDCDPFYVDAKIPEFLKRVLDFVEV